jgi:hypothetical protein
VLRGCASALVDGRPISLPIPTSMPTATRYRDLAAPIPEIVRDLTGGRLTCDQPCHLDPDIDRSALRMTRPQGWRGALGQASAALSHLRNTGVRPGDVFLFWGLFRACERAPLGWRYTGPRRHVIFGWLQVDEIIDLGPDGSHVLIQYPWLEQHPHVRSGWTGRNAIFLAKDVFTIGDGSGFWGLRSPYHPHYIGGGDAVHVGGTTLARSAQRRGRHDLQSTRKMAWQWTPDSRGARTRVCC